MIINNIKDYVLDTEFRMIIKNHKIGIVNYLGIDHFDGNKITVSYKNGKILVNGDNLVISKLLKDEILIAGNIDTIKMVTDEK